VAYDSERKEESAGFEEFAASSPHGITSLNRESSSSKSSSSGGLVFVTGSGGGLNSGDGGEGGISVDVFTGTCGNQHTLLSLIQLTHPESV